MEPNDFRLFRCKCGHVAFGVSREYAEKEVESFNFYYESLPDVIKEQNYGSQPSDISRYEQCVRCGSSHHDFVETDDCPDGVTVNPIIVESM